MRRIHFSKRQSLVVGLGAIVVFFAVSVSIFKENQTFSSREAREENLREIVSDAKTDSGPNQAVFVLNDFERSELENGKKLWEIKGKRGQFFPESNTAKLKQATLWVFRKNGEVTELKAEEALVYLSGASFSKAEASGGVTVIHNQKVQIDAESATYDRVKNEVFAPGHVEIKGEVIDVTGTELRVDLEKGEMRLSSDVTSVIKPRGGIAG